MRRAYQPPTYETPEQLYERTIGAAERDLADRKAAQPSEQLSAALDARIRLAAGRAIDFLNAQGVVPLLHKVLEMAIRDGVTIGLEEAQRIYREPDAPRVVSAEENEAMDAVNVTETDS